MANTIIFRTDEETERATRMRREVLRDQPSPADGVNVAEELARDRAGER